MLIHSPVNVAPSDTHLSHFKCLIKRDDRWLGSIYTALPNQYIIHKEGH